MKPGYPFRRLSFLPAIPKGGKLPTEFCQDVGDWVHFPAHCEETQCPKLLHVEGYGIVCQDKWEWERNVVRAKAGSGDPSDGSELVGYDWDILRADLEFSAKAEAHFRKELELAERERKLSEEALGEPNEALREREERIREKLRSPREMKVRRVIDMEDDEEED